MLVYMLKDVEKVGMAGTVVKVSDGHARNILLPRKLAIEVRENERAFYEAKAKQAKITAEVVTSKVAMLAERIRNLHVTIKRRAHDDGKLYGAVNAEEIVELLGEKEIPINKKQVEFGKGIRTLGEHKAVIRLNSKLRPELTVKVISMNEQAS